MHDHEQPDVTVRRAYQIYLYAVCFVTMIVTLIMGGIGIYALFRIIAPGVMAPGSGDHSFERKAGASNLILALVFVGVSLAIFAWHWARSLELRAELAQVLAPPPPPPPPIEPPQPAAPSAPELPPARKRAPRRAP